MLLAARGACVSLLRSGGTRDGEGCAVRSVVCRRRGYGESKTASKTMHTHQSHFFVVEVYALVFSVQKWIEIGGVV